MEQTAKPNGETNRWAKAAPGDRSYFQLVQRIQSAVLDGAGAEWVLVRADPSASKLRLRIEMLGGDVEKARGFIDPMLPTAVPYSFEPVGRRRRLAIHALRRIAKLNQRSQKLYRDAMIRAVRAVGGSFNTKT